ncbi:MAG: phosphoenolpyruvate carboxylase [Myxococcota bacterium]|nr:phosphoenolpyruvate carboxylase [Myxococcota bacterium]
MEEVLRGKEDLSESSKHTLAEFKGILEQFRAEKSDNPDINPVILLATHISERLANKTLGLDALRALLQSLTTSAFAGRVERLRDYLEEVDLDKNDGRFRALIDAQAHDEEGNLVPFELFQSIVERQWLGIVATAHPTFAFSSDIYGALTQLTSGINSQGEPLSESDQENLWNEIHGCRHVPDADLSLGQEHQLSIEALKNVHWAIRRMYEVVLEVGEERYPGEWCRLKPQLLTVASWVGYDLDGRSDIKWYHSLFSRVKVEVSQLQDYLLFLDELRGKFQSCLREEPEVVSFLERIEDKLRTTEYASQANLESLERDCEGPEEVSRLSLQFVRSLDVRLTRAGELLTLLSSAVEQCSSNELKRQLCVMRAEVANFGLGLAHTHVRLNSSQLHNAIRRDLKLDGSPDDAGQRRGVLEDLRALFQVNDKPVLINFGSVMSEQMTAKRLFMVVAQILKFIDGDDPIRFLIAECDTPFTVLTALYFAKLFGVDKQIDISPLFETETALERADSLFEKLLEIPEYLEYIRGRGRLCVQTGFSDAGRYLGQVAAGMAIERLRMKLARLMSRTGIQDVELVIFDTHGESIGRGAHPRSFTQRLEYVSSPASRILFREEGIQFKQELSFQGGDGFLYFGNHQMAYATAVRLMEHALSRPEREPDTFYSQANRSLDFFITVKEFNEAVMEDSSYGQLIDVFGSNLLFGTGSRVVRRDGGGKKRHRKNHPSQIRAIPHNAILQQMGFMANSLGGVGTAVGRDKEPFLSLYQDSARFRCLFDLVGRAYTLSRLEYLEAYLRLFDRGYWLSRAQEADEIRQRSMRRISGHLARENQYPDLRSIYLRLAEDFFDLEYGCDLLEDEEFKEAQDPELDIVHSIRHVLIQEIFLYAVRIPRFSSQADITVAEVVDDLFHLDVVGALDILARAFPVKGESIDPDIFGEAATYVSDKMQGYDQEHRELFQPIMELYDLLRESSAVISYKVGAFG